MQKPFINAMKMLYPKKLMQKAITGKWTYIPVSFFLCSFPVFFKFLCQVNFFILLRLRLLFLVQSLTKYSFIPKFQPCQQDAIDCLQTRIMHARLKCNIRKHWFWESYNPTKDLCNNAKNKKPNKANFLSLPPFLVHVVDKLFNVPAIKVFP